MSDLLYLNDPLMLGLNLSLSTPQTVSYKVYIKDIGAKTDWEMIYTGSIYYVKPCSVILNDIIQTYVNDFYWFNFDLYADRPVKVDYTHMYFNIKTEVSYDNTTSTHTINNIFNGYRSPNGGYTTAFDPTGSDALKSAHEYGFNVRPRVPSLKKYESSPFSFPCYVYKNNTVNKLALGLYKNDSLVSIKDNAWLTIYDTDSPIVDTSLYLLDLRITDASSIGVSANGDNAILCDIDSNPADYYLLWINRFGAAQCQPFCKKNTLKESVKTNYITRPNNNTAATNNHRLQLNPQVPYSKTVEYTWTLNSDWLTYDEYNEFESLLTSKYVYLFDYKHNTVYDVVVSTANWEYKNPKNTKKPFNLTIDVKKASVDNIIY